MDNGEKRIEINIEEELAKMQGNKRWRKKPPKEPKNKEKKQSKETADTKINKEITAKEKKTKIKKDKEQITGIDNNKKTASKRDKWNTRGLITGLVIALLSIIVAIEVGYAYTTRYNNELDKNKELTADIDDLQKDLDIYKTKVDILQGITVGDKITVASLKRFNSYFKHDYNIDAMNNKGEKVTDIDNLDSKLVYVVFSKGKDNDKYHYVFKQIGEIDSTGKPEDNKAVGQIGQTEIEKAGAEDSTKQK